MIVRIPPYWREHTVGDVRTTHTVPRIKRDEWSGGDGVPIQIVHLRGTESDGMLGIVVDGWRFYAMSQPKEDGGGYAGGAIVAGKATALVARITDAGCVVEIRDAEPVA